MFSLFIFKEVVCTWCVHGVHSHGVGCVKQNGLESAWAAIGSVKTFYSQYFSICNKCLYCPPYILVNYFTLSLL